MTGRFLPTRRAVLRGAGVAVALPFLESLFPAGRASTTTRSPMLNPVASRIALGIVICPFL